MPRARFAATMPILLAALAPFGAALAEPAPVRLDYALYAGGFHALDLTARLDLGAADYGLQVQARTTGWIGRLFPFVLESRATGRRQAPTPRPSSYRSANRWGDSEVRWVAVAYADDGPPRVRAAPPLGEDDRAVVPASARLGTVDPLSGIFDLLQAEGGGCLGSVPVFDGRRRYDVIGTPMGRRVIPESSYTIHEGPAEACRLRIEPVSGFWRKFNEESRYAGTVRVWTAPVAEDLPPVPVRVEAETGFSAIRVHLTAIHRGDAAALPDTGLDILEEALVLPGDIPQDGR